ncbi:MAG: non-canonical purine NTP pyrophosphatase [Bryobacteraceae bacterium]|nr:non-canonical purine NTP pyrophosphatase [Bryobacteraceae bacterium]
MTSNKIVVTYVTSSDYKIQENMIVCSKVKLSNSLLVGDVFDFRIRQVPIKEVLEVDLTVMVLAEVTQAYSEIRVPCIVEHAGLIFEGLEHVSYPGGLTKPMWNALGKDFVEETQSEGRRVMARAVIAYCDGMTVKTFTGETKGTICKFPRGARPFYWDPVFVPDNPDGTQGTRTYAEIVDDVSLGLEYKVTALSQSTKAMVSFLEYRRTTGDCELWPPLG